MEYTKGNWEIERIGNEGKWAIHTGDFTTPFAHTFPNRYRSPLVSAEEAEANARLIASSPRMYETLRNVHESASFIRLPSLLREMVSKAIAKAEGGK